ncbi:MAG: hypothetical protein U0694_15845 [Anaerolineae bacterium]
MLRADSGERDTVTRRQRRWLEPHALYDHSVTMTGQLMVSRSPAHDNVILTAEIWRELSGIITDR